MLLSSQRRIPRHHLPAAIACCVALAAGLLACTPDEPPSVTERSAPASDPGEPPEGAEHAAGTEPGTPSADAVPSAAPLSAAAPTGAGAQPDPSGASATAQVATPSPATGPLALVVLSEHELLRSEQRFVDRVVARFARRGVEFQQQDAGERRAPLLAWLNELAPERRSSQRLALATGSSRGLLVLRYAPPVDGHSVGIRGFGVLLGGAPREVLWSQGGAFTEDTISGIAALFSGDSVR